VAQYIGIALSKAKSFMTQLNGRGQEVEQVELAHTTRVLQPYLARLPADARIAVEATSN